MNSVATGRGPLSPSRDEILAVLEAGMRPDPGVHAMWIDEHPLVIFDRDGTLRFEHADEDALAAEPRERVGQLREDFSLFRS